MTFHDPTTGQNTASVEEKFPDVVLTPQPSSVPDGTVLLGTLSSGESLVLDYAYRPYPEDQEAGDPWPEANPDLSRRTWMGLREIAAELDPEDSSWLALATALANWHADNAYCPSCGSPTRVIANGWVRTCDTENREIFPRTDPAVIAAVIHTDDTGIERILLGNSTRWPRDRFSTFAGFVEAGESLESAVAREVREEAGVAVTEVLYQGSQPWPFPRSLMIGFRASIENREDAVADGQEIAAVRWFTREELGHAVSAGEIGIPGKLSIAHHLIRDWYGSPLPHTAE